MIRIIPPALLIALFAVAPASAQLQEAQIALAAVHVTDAVPSEAPAIMHQARLRGNAHPALIYPEKARRFGIEGSVAVAYTVDVKGRVRDARIVDGIGYNCDLAVLDWIERVRFHPAVDTAGNPAAASYVTTVVFDLDSEQ